MNGMCTFLTDLKMILSNPLFYYHIYPEAKKIIEESGFSMKKESEERFCKKDELNVFKLIIENGFGKKVEEAFKSNFISSCGKGKIAIKLTKEQIEFEKEQVKNLDEIKFKDLMWGLSEVPCERRMHNRGHYFEELESGFCLFCKRHAYGIKRNHEKDK